MRANKLHDTIAKLIAIINSIGMDKTELNFAEA
jgi:hypothetical protein